MGKNAGPDPIDVTVGARMRIRRRTLGLSQTQLAVALGITFQQIQKYEKGSNRISASMLVRAAEFLQTSVAALVGEDGTEPLEAGIMADLATPGAQALLEAFAKVRDGEARRALIAITVDLSKSGAGTVANFA